MIDIVFINCPPFWLKLPPLSLSYLNSYTKSLDYNSNYFDLNILFYSLIKNIDIKKKWEKKNKNFYNNLFEVLYKQPFFSKWFSDFINFLIKNKVKYIGFSIFESNLDFSLKLSNLIKSKINIKIIFGGPEITLYHKKINFQNIDFIVIGEGEIAIKKILESKTNKNIKFLEIQDINQLPFPEFKKETLKKYKIQNCLPLFISRGCINNCHFCTEKNLFKKKFRIHSYEYVINMILYYKKVYNIKWFIFQDSMLNADLTFLKNFCESLIEQKINIKWEAQIGIRKDMDLKTMELMKQSGCYNLFIGLESGSDLILKKMNKAFNTNDASLFFQKCFQANLHFEISLIFGYYNETNKTIQETFNFIKNNAEFIPKIAQINPYLKYHTDREIFLHKNIDLFNIINKFINMIKELKITYTPAFINNLINKENN